MMYFGGASHFQTHLFYGWTLLSRFPDSGCTWDSRASSTGWWARCESVMTCHDQLKIVEGYHWYHAVISKIIHRRDFPNKTSIYSGFSHETWWFSIAMLVITRG
jgi:hypothetical protein